MNDDEKKPEGEKRLSAIIKIEDFPNRNEVTSFFKVFMRNKVVDNEYNIVSKQNELIFYIKNPDYAYKFLETFNNETKDKPIYCNTKSTLSFRTLNNSNSVSILKNKYKFPNIKPRYMEKKSSNSALKYKGNTKIIENAFNRKHWADIKMKAGSMNIENPFSESHSTEYLAMIKNKKKWLDQKGFNSCIGKATLSHHYYIQNYVRVTPSKPVMFYQFRNVEKNKWINKDGFSLY